MTEHGAGRADDPGDRDGIAVHRVGPGQRMAADSSFGVALVTLWHRVIEAGGSVGFARPVGRAEVAPAAAAVVEDLRQGRAAATALTAGHELVGFGMVIPGRLVLAHTGALRRVMVDPDRQGRGLGNLLLTELLTQAGDLGLDRLELSVRADEGLEAFYERHGFAVCGRRPGWIRVTDGELRDEVLMARLL